MASSSSSETPATGATFDDFYSDLKDTEKKDAVLTPKQQIERLLRPGATYRNLNPFEVLMIEPNLSMDEVRRRYRRLSILVHPDKNPEDRDRAQAAFDAVKKAYEVLEDEKTRAKCMEVVEEAEGRTRLSVEDKKKALRKAGKDDKVDEDDPEKFKQSVKVLTMKLFADMERRRRTLEQKLSEEAAKKREAELAAEERKNLEKEFNKNWEESRQTRVNSWMDFKSGATAKGNSAGKEKSSKKSKKKFSPMGFRPPKTKPEAR